jgi:hypothetical protein
MAFNTSLSDLKKYVRLSNQNDVSVILEREPVIIQKYLSSLLGLALITEIETWGSETAVKLQIYKNTCNILAKLCVLAYIPENEVQISDGGLLRFESSTQKTAYSGQVDRLSKALEEEAYLLIDFVIETFFANGSLSINWINSPVYESSLNSVFKTAKQFSAIVKMTRPYQGFIALQELISIWTDKSLNKRYDPAVVATVLGGSTSPNVLLFLKNLRMAIAYKTIREASFMNLVQFDGYSVKFLGGSDQNSYQNEVSGNPSHIAVQQRHFQHNYEMNLAACDSLVETNPTDFGTTPAADPDTSDKQFYA